MRNINFSVVIPIFNEEQNIVELYSRVKEIMEKICVSDISGLEYNEASLITKKLPDKKMENFGSQADSLVDSFEIFMVNDGSTDNSWKVIEKLHREDARLKGINFSKNFGHHIALTAGLDHAKGNFVVIMDGDLQDPPEEILKLYNKIKEGFDIVYAIRDTRKDSFVKKLYSKFFHIVFRLFTDVKIDAKAGTFRIMNRKAVDSLNKCRERSRFLQGLTNWIGFSKIGVITKRDERYSGKTKYNIFKSIRLALDAITSFSYFPLRVTIYLGFFVACISFIIGMYQVVIKVFFGAPIFGYTSIIVSILFIGGVQLSIIGIIGEYIGRLYKEIQNRPIYIIDKFLE